MSFRFLFALAFIAAVVGCQCQQRDAVWRLDWIDEFDGESLNSNYWMVEESCWGGGNQERQCYTNRPNNIEVANGVLIIRAIPEEFTGRVEPNWRSPNSNEVVTRSYTSGKILTKSKHAWTFGRFSAKIKLPGGQGTWPAFWMMPETSTYGRWPLSGEIDIMEAVNLGTPCDLCQEGTEAQSSGAIHFGDRVPNNEFLLGKTDETVLIIKPGTWYVFSVEWAHDQIQWFVDDHLFMRIEAPSWNSAGVSKNAHAHPPFDQPFHLILNLAVGGNLAERSNGRGFNPDSFPAEMHVDWVKVETCQSTSNVVSDCQTTSGDPPAPLGSDDVIAR